MKVITIKICTLFLVLFTMFLFTSCDSDKKITDTRGFQRDLQEIIDDVDAMNNMYSISIALDGETISENYFGYSKESYVNNVFSVTKSVTSLLVGIAIDKGYIESVDQLIVDFIDFSEYDVPDGIEDITIKNLLTMSAGLSWDSNNLSGEMQLLRTSSDPLGLIIERDLAFTPGTQFNYSDGSAHLVSILLAEATGMSAYEFAVLHLFTPLGINDSNWRLDRDGDNIGGCDLFLSSRDMILIGNLVLNNGIHNGEQIVSHEWLLESTSNQIGDFASHEYGYFWWLSEKDGYELISARGWGGQQIYIVPELNLVLTSATNGSVADQTASNQYVAIEYVLVHRILPLFFDN